MTIIYSQSKIHYCINKNFYSLAINLIEKLCSIKPIVRYKAEQALMHPWITRNLDDKIPRTLYEENDFVFQIDSKMRKVRL